MLKALKDLALALVNATLILIALCLFLAWKLADTVDHATSNFAQNLISVAPLREDIQGATTELAALRADLAKVSAQSGDMQSASLKRIQTGVDHIKEDLDNARQSIADLSQAPARLVDHAIETATGQLAQGINDVRGCVPPQS